MTAKTYTSTTPAQREMLSAVARVAAVLAGEYAQAEYAVGEKGIRTTVENITASTADVFAQSVPGFDREDFYLAALGRSTVRETFYCPWTLQDRCDFSAATTDEVDEHVRTVNHLTRRDQPAFELL